MNRPAPIVRDSNEFYEAVPPDVRQALKIHEEIRTVPAGTCLIREGVLPDGLIIINAGSVGVSVPSGEKSIPLAVAGTGKVFGLRSLVSGALPEVTITCQEECTITFVSSRNFAALLKEYPTIYFAIAKVLSLDLKMADDLLRHIPRARRPAWRHSSGHKQG